MKHIARLLGKLGTMCVFEKINMDLRSVDIMPVSTPTHRGPVTANECVILADDMCWYNSVTSLSSFIRSKVHYMTDWKALAISSLAYRFAIQVHT